MAKTSVDELFASLRVNPLFLMNLLGRPAYWAPQIRWESDSSSGLLACGMFYQKGCPPNPVETETKIMQISFVSTHDRTCKLKSRRSPYICATTHPRT
jgi:hypothetical protein